MKSAEYVIRGTPEALVGMLAKRRSEGNTDAIPSRLIAAMLGINQRSVLAAVNELRHAHVPIARGDRGLFYALNKEELEPTIMRLEASVFEMLEVIRALKSIYSKAGDQLSLL